MLSTGEITAMRATAERSFLDRCTLGVPTDAAWGADPGGASYAYGDAIDCGFDTAPAGEAEDGTQAPLVDATLRVPVGTTIDERYRVRMTARHGEALAEAEEYAVMGAPRRGVSCLVCDLTRVEGNSVR